MHASNSNISWYDEVKSVVESSHSVSNNKPETPTNPGQPRKYSRPFVTSTSPPPQRARRHSAQQVAESSGVRHSIHCFTPSQSTPSRSTPTREGGAYGNDGPVCRACRSKFVSCSETHALDTILDDFTALLHRRCETIIASIHEYQQEEDSVLEESLKESREGEGDGDNDKSDALTSTTSEEGSSFRQGCAKEMNKMPTKERTFLEKAVLPTLEDMIQLTITVKEVRERREIGAVCASCCEAVQKERESGRIEELKIEIINGNNESSEALKDDMKERQAKKSEGSMLSINGLQEKEKEKEEEKEKDNRDGRRKEETKEKFDPEVKSKRESREGVEIGGGTRVAAVTAEQPVAEVPVLGLKFRVSQGSLKRRNQIQSCMVVR